MSWQRQRGCSSSVCILNFRFFVLCFLWVAVFLSSFPSTLLPLLLSLLSISVYISVGVCVSVRNLCVCVWESILLSDFFFSCQCNGASAVIWVCCLWVALHQPQCLIGFRSLHSCFSPCRHCWCACTSMCKDLEAMLFSSCGCIWV